MDTQESEQSGLGDAEARRRLAKDGPNELPQSSQRSRFALLRDVVTEPMFLLLVACGAIYMVLGDRGEAIMLLCFVVVVISITFFQQRRAEKSLSALRDLSSPRALVMRDGAARRIPGREIVCGDLVLLAEGDRVPADLVLLEASNLLVDESMLTGESEAVSKCSSSIQGCQDVSHQFNPDCQAYAGTLIVQGTALGLVTATGARSTLGKIGASLASIAGELTPIQSETAHIVKIVAIGGIGLAILLAIGFGALRGDWLHAALAGLTLAMAVIPEEIPVILALFLGLGAWRLSREGVLARNVAAVELLGATTVLCVDKTGTLTMNRMALAELDCNGGRFRVANPSTGNSTFPEDFHLLLEYAVLASHRRAFDPMEAAITTAGSQLLADTEHLHQDWTLVSDYPLSREMLAMSRVWQSPGRNEYLIAAKGAPEAIVDLCHLEPSQAADISLSVSQMAADGLRVLGVARAVFPSTSLPQNQHDFEFEFMGLIALADPVRPDVPGAIAECHAAGIRVVMITGDHPSTATAIAKQAGLSVHGHVLTGGELDAMSDDALALKLREVDVFCRVKPEQKLRLVKAFRALGEIVAMTGDGVNDAPALKAAHIGVAMGARGTDVAREAASLVLLNDDFASLVRAVRYGRRIYSNLRKAIVFIVAVHTPIVGLSVVPVLFGWPMILMPAHILFLQLIIDPSCSMVFEAEELEKDAMLKKPRLTSARLFDLDLLVRGLWQGSGLFILLLGTYIWSDASTGSDAVARAMVFTVLVLSNIGLIYSNRTWSASAWNVQNQKNLYFSVMAILTVALLLLVLFAPGLVALFSFTSLSVEMLLTAGIISLLSIFWFESVKLRRG